MRYLADQVREIKTTGSDQKGKRKLARREKFGMLDIYLPLVNWVNDRKHVRWTTNKTSCPVLTGPCSM